MDIDRYLENLKEGRIIPESELRQCCRKMKELLIQEPNVVVVNTPVTICGDVHGQFYDVLELFKKSGGEDNGNYIFIGDFVDRGYNSVETFEYLMCLKLKYPKKVFLLRGNHESRQITVIYGFLDEITRKYGNSNPWNYCNEIFDLLPLGAVVDGEIFCIHGGLSPDMRTIDNIRTIERN